jgi:hypothetical protein
MQAQKLDLAVSAGTDGVGVDLGARLGKVVGIRTGVSYVPKFSYDMKFGVQLGENDGPTVDENGNVVESRFHRLASKMEEMTGLQINDYVKMKGRPSFTNFKFLVDVHPIPQDRRWTVTAGFYLGSSTVAKAENTTSEVATLMGVTIYNKMYDKVLEGEPLVTVGETGLYLTPELEEKISSYGRMGINVGVHKDGTTYFMEPDEHSMVSARVKVNRFRPYLGLGFTDALGSSKRLNYGVDCGALFWGGVPQIVTHDGTDLADLQTVYGHPGDYVDLIKKFKVYPVLTFRVAYQLWAK